MDFVYIGMFNLLEVMGTNTNITQFYPKYDLSLKIKTDNNTTFNVGD
ncbi:hypothetical protein [Clostridium fungisolvens]|nr:hypothetical protein [Clostridium fungisolvens]